MREGPFTDVVRPYIKFGINAVSKGPVFQTSHAMTIPTDNAVEGYRKTMGTRAKPIYKVWDQTLFKGVAGFGAEP